MIDLRCEVLPARRSRFLGPALIAFTVAFLAVIGIRVAMERTHSRLDAGILDYPIPRARR